MRIPARFRLPTTLQEYCQMLDSQGPRLIVFFVRPGTGMERFNTLIECALQQYDFHDVSAEAQLHDVAYYFLRREAAYP